MYCQPQRPHCCRVTSEVCERANPQSKWHWQHQGYNRITVFSQLFLTEFFKGIPCNHLSIHHTSPDLLVSWLIQWLRLTQAIGSAPPENRPFSWSISKFVVQQDNNDRLHLVEWPHHHALLVEKKLSLLKQPSNKPPQGTISGSRRALAWPPSSESSLTSKRALSRLLVC